MKIEVWSDFVCPYCYVGKHRLEAALERFAHAGSVTVEYRCFELDPDQSRDAGQDLMTHLASQYNLSREAARAMIDRVEQMVQEAGLPVNFAAVKPTNTLDAHRLMHLARVSGRERILAAKIFTAYFQESRLISDPDTLSDLAMAAGMDPLAVSKLLADQTQYLDGVRQDEAAAYEIDFPVIPHFVINRKYSISATPPLEDFLATLHEAWLEENSHSDSEGGRSDSD